jgi:hypothetical protein
MRILLRTRNFASQSQALVDLPPVTVAEVVSEVGRASGRASICDGGCDLPVDEVGDGAAATEDEGGVDRGTVLGEERPRVCVEGGRVCEQHRPTEEGHERTTAEGVREVRTRRQPCHHRWLASGDEEEDIGHDGGGLVAVRTGMARSASG